MPILIATTRRGVSLGLRGPFGQMEKMVEAPDKLDVADQVYLSRVVATEFPSHDLQLHANDEGLNWIVLEPHVGRPDLLRFTICRLDHNVMVLIENRDAERRYRSTSDLEAAVRLMHDVAEEALRAFATPHPVPRVFQ